MPPEIGLLLDAVSKLGALGLAVALVGLFIWGILRSGRLVDADRIEDRSDFAAQLKKVEAERDDWKTLAQGTTPELRRLNDLLDTAVKLLLDRRPPV